MLFASQTGPLGRPSRKPLALGALLAAVVLPLGACGSGSSGGAYAHAATPKTATATPATQSQTTSVHAASVAGHTVLVSGSGFTLYVLSPERVGHLLCTGDECLGFWPPAPAGAHSSLRGVSGKLGTLARPGGVSQLTIDGQPLYTYALDHHPGEADGEGIKSFGGTWLEVQPDGTTLQG
jgi:predicted lipoprotein with Yx(FWY)xxD motif